MPHISDEQILALKAKFDKLVEDNKSAAQATADSTDAHTRLQQVQAEVSQKDAIEAAADAVVAGDTADVKTSIDALVSMLGEPPAPPAVPPPGNGPA